MDIRSAASDEGTTLSALVISPYVITKGNKDAPKAYFHPCNVVAVLSQPRILSLDMLIPKWCKPTGKLILTKLLKVCYSIYLSYSIILFQCKMLIRLYCKKRLYTLSTVARLILIREWLLYMYIYAWYYWRNMREFISCLWNLVYLKATSIKEDSARWKKVWKWRFS